MTKHKMGNRTFLLGTVVVAFALFNAGCGGTSTAKSSATPASPFALGINTTQGSKHGPEASGLGLPASVASPSGTDIGYDTYATAITPLNGAPPIVIDPTLTVTVGVPSTAAGASRRLGDAAPAGQAGVTFRADIANGQTASGNVPKITAATLTSADPQWSLGTLPLTFQYDATSAAGPFASATYTTAPFTLPFTTSGPHTVSVTVTDAIGQSTQTDYVINVVAATDVAAYINTIDTGTVDADGAAVIYTLAPGDTATITGGSGATATADATGTAVLFTTPGTQTLTVSTTDSTVTPPVTTTYTQTLDLTASTPGSTYAQVKRRVGAVKARH